MFFNSSGQSRSLGNRGASSIELGSGELDLGLADDERRQELHDIVAGLDREHLLGAQSLEQVLVRHLAFQTEHQPLPAYLLDDIAMIVLERGETLLQPEPHLRDAIEEAVFKHHVEYSIADGHGERVAAESRAVAAGGHSCAHCLGGEAGADGEAAAEPLGRGKNIGLDSGPFMGIETPGTPNPGLDLVEQQNDALLVGKRTEILEEAPRDLTHAAFAHDRLDQNSCGLVADRPLDGHDVQCLDLVEPVDRGAEAFEMLGLTAGGDGGKRAAMKRALEGDKPVALRRAVLEMIAARGLDRAFDGLGTGIGEEHPIREGRRADLSARRSCSGMRCKFDTCQSFFAWLVRASTRCGCAWPRAVTATPLAKSR